MADDRPRDLIPDSGRKGEPRSLRSSLGESRLYGFSCGHMTVTAAAGTLAKVTGHCGCEMRPLYAEHGSQTFTVGG